MARVFVPPMEEDLIKVKKEKEVREVKENG